MIEFVFEIVFQFVAEFVVTLLWPHHATAIVDDQTPLGRMFRIAGFALSGAVLGGLSLIFLPSALIHSPALRLLNVIATPLAVGFFAIYADQLKKIPSRHLGYADHFLAGFGFALAISLVRYFFAKA